MLQRKQGSGGCYTIRSCAYCSPRKGLLSGEDSEKRRSYGDFVNQSTPITQNVLFSALAGTTWFLQFFFAIGVGHIAHKIEKLGQILNVEVVNICYAKK